VPVTLAVPLADGVKVTEQVPATDNVHGEPMTLPVPVARTTPTEPAGVEAPPPAVSVTVALQVEPWFTNTGVAQVTLVEVERGVGTTAADVPELVAWTESFGVYVPVTVKLAVVDGVKVTLQLAVAKAI
jgi:hypothetical protein